MLPDPPIVEWIEKQNRQLTYSELAAACVAHFGADRSWTASQIRAYWLAAHVSIERSPIDKDQALLSFLRERVGRISGDALLKICRREFPAERVPSRSALYRWIDRERSHGIMSLSADRPK